MSSEKNSPVIKPGVQNNYETAWNEAAGKLSHSDIKDIARKSGVKFVNEKDASWLILPFLNREIKVSHPQINIAYARSAEEVPLWLQILTLHYLITAKGTPLSGNDITFKQLDGGLAYYPTFQKRSIKIIEKVFGDDLEGFIETGEKIGGTPADYGDYSLSFKAFPKVEIFFIFWKGDDEFPREGNVVFDSSIADYLSAEDIAVLCNMIAVMILKKSYEKPS